MNKKAIIWSVVIVALVVIIIMYNRQSPITKAYQALINCHAKNVGITYIVNPCQKEEESFSALTSKKV